MVVTPPPDATGGAKAEPIKMKSITVDEVDFDSIAKQAPPNFLKMRILGVDVDNKPAAGIDLHALAGIDKVSADFQFDYRIDPAKKTLTVNRIEIDLNGLARLEISMVLDNVDAAQPDKAMNDTTLRTASIVYDDRSLLAKSLPAAAKSMSMPDPAAGDDRDGQDLPRARCAPARGTRRRRSSTRSNPTWRTTRRRKDRCA